MLSTGGVGQKSEEEVLAEAKARKVRAANRVQYISGTLFGGGAIVLSVLNLFGPIFYESRFFDFWTIAPFFFGIGLIVYSGYRRQITQMDYDLTEQEQSVSVSAEHASRVVLSGAGRLSGGPAEDPSNPNESGHKRRASDLLDEQAMQSKAHLNSPFELYVNAVVSAIDKRINISEIKANNLLGQGKALMLIGVLFYIFLMAAFQLAVHAWGYSHALAVGMASASLIFLVFEFLAAWFLKQYRSYVDASMAYLQVRSAFNNYLLVYYSVNQFAEDLENRDTLVSVLTKEIQWPSINDLGRYDVNHMLESVSSLSKVVDSLQVFKAGKKKKKSSPEGDAET